MLHAEGRPADQKILMRSRPHLRPLTNQEDTFSRSAKKRRSLTKQAGDGKNEKNIGFKMFGGGRTLTSPGEDRKSFLLGGALLVPNTEGKEPTTGCTKGGDPEKTTSQRTSKEKGKKELLT